MSVINTNITSMISQSNLNKSKGALTTAMERLSSGMRINSAKDDAAGQAIANRMTSQIKGLAQAQRNANDGISVAQTAEGALNQINDNLQRVRELTVQAQNGTNSTEDKDSIQAEINQRLNEINRISEETNFNGTKVLSSTTTMKIQVGANDGETISIGLKKIDSASLGMEGFSVSQKALPVSEAISHTTNNGGTPAEVNLSSVATALKVDVENLSLHNVTTAAGAPTATYVVKSGEDFYAVSVNDGTGAVALNKADLKFQDDDNSITTDVALADQYVKVALNSSGVVTGYATIQGRNFSVANAALANGGGTATDDNNTATIELSGTNATAEFTGAATNDPLALIDEALKTVDTFRSDLGAIQNRFESAITNLQTNETNLSASRSRIEDADYAKEVANMTRAQILQQAGTSVLAQANQVPQGVLSLLR